MRIAIIVDPLDNQRAGVHVYTREFINALLARESKHEYILLREKVDPSLNVRQIAIPNIHLPIGFASVRLFFLLPLVARWLKVDAVYEPAHFGPFNLPGRIRRITMIHDLTPILFSEYHRFHSQLLQKIFLKSILRRADLVLSNSHNTTADLHRVFPVTKAKTETIHLGREAFYQPTDQKTYLSSKGVHAPYFIFVGTIEPRKNLELLLDAYENFKQWDQKGVQLLIVGQKGWKSESFFEKLERHPFRSDIVLTGYVDKKHLPELYSHSLALIYPSIYEGFGLPVLEAMSCGTNVICPRNSSLTEVGGEYAFFYPTQNKMALVEQMKRLAEGGTVVEQRRAGVRHWAEGFSWETYVKRFEEALEKLR